MSTDSLVDISKRPEPGWKYGLKELFKQRDQRETETFAGIINAFTNALQKSKQPIKGFQDQTERLQVTQHELACSKKELADAYENSAKHARALFDYIEKTKEMETKLHSSNLQIDAMHNEKENLLLRIQKLESDCQARTEAFNTLTSEYRSLEHSYRQLEQKLRDQKKTVYNANEQTEQFDRQRERMETQIFQSAKIINDLNEELAALYDKLRAQKEAVAQKQSQTKRSRNMSDIEANGASGAKLLNSSSLGSISLVSTSMLDASALCMGMYDKPPIGKHRILSAHNEPVSQVTYNAQGNMLVSCSNDKTVKTWTTLSGSNCRTFTGSTRSVRCAEFSMDGRYVVAGSADNAIYQWDQKSGKLVQKLHGHRDKVTVVKFLDATTLISGSHDRKLQLWDLNRGSVISSLNSCGSRVNDVCTTPLNTVITANSDQSIRLFDVRSMELIDKIDSHSDIVTSVACSSDYSTILTSSRDGSLQLIDCHKMESIREFRASEYSNRSELNRACFSGTEKYVMAGASNGKVFIWDTKTGELFDSTPRISGSITNMGCALSGFQMATATQDGTIVLWDQ